jgi:hypothetical protein
MEISKSVFLILFITISVVHLKSMEFVYNTGTAYYGSKSKNDKKDKKNKNDKKDKKNKNDKKDKKNKNDKKDKNDKNNKNDKNDKKCKNKSSIWDIIHSNFADYSDYNYSKNWYLLVFIVPIILNINNFSYNFMYEFIVKFMILILLRAFTIISTIFPRNSKLKVKLNKKTDFWSLLYHKIIGGGCYDKLFSGHAAFGLLLTLLLFKYNFLESNVFNITLYSIFNIIHFLMITITRSHFTVDVIVAIYMTLWVHGVRLDTLL